MKCPECNAWTSVLYTRPMAGSRRRRYLCANNHRLWTEEKIIPGRFSSRTEKTDAVLSTDNLPNQSTKKPTP